MKFQKGKKFQLRLRLSPPTDPVPTVTGCSLSTPSSCIAQPLTGNSFDIQQHNSLGSSQLQRKHTAVCVFSPLISASGIVIFLFRCSHPRRTGKQDFPYMLSSALIAPELSLTPQKPCSAQGLVEGERKKEWHTTPCRTLFQTINHGECPRKPPTIATGSTESQPTCPN